jgi:tetratricopeptide (TPR) repeat protein
MGSRPYRLFSKTASVLILTTALARAGEPSAATTATTPCGVRQARAQFELGQAHMKLNAYEQAIDDFETGYACIPMPIFLYDIAQMARLSGQKTKALEYYRRYLAAEPQARERPAVERWIAVLSRTRGTKAAGGTRPVPPAATSPLVIAPPPAPLPAPAPAVVPASLPPAALTATRPAPERPSHRGRWIALGVVGGVLVVGGVVTAAILLTRPASDGVPHGFYNLGAIDSTPH